VLVLVRLSRTGSLRGLLATLDGFYIWHKTRIRHPQPFVVAAPRIALDLRTRELWDFLLEHTQRTSVKAWSCGP
jgi:hypothetical protein